MKRNLANLCLLGVLVLVACAPRIRRPVAGEKVVVHTVAPGESIEDIATDYYGEPGRAREIARFNGIHSDEAPPGSVLRIPLTPDEMAALSRREQARVPYNEGLALISRGSWLDATRRFRRATQMDPRFSEAYYNLGVAYARMKSYRAAARELGVAVKLRPRRADFANALGTAFFHLEKWHDAIRAFRKALDANPHHLKAQFSLAAAYEKDGQIKNARRAWRRYLELDDTSEWAKRARHKLDTTQ